VKGPIVEHIPGRPIGPGDDVVISSDELPKWRDAAIAAHDQRKRQELEAAIGKDVPNVSRHYLGVNEEKRRLRQALDIIYPKEKK